MGLSSSMQITPSSRIGGNSLDSSDNGTLYNPLPWDFSTPEQCEQLYRNKEISGIVCNATWDGFLCWPPAVAGSVAFLPCPPVRGVDPAKMAFKKCSPDGRWEGKKPGDFHRWEGWTNYTTCYLPGVQKMISQLYKKEEQVQIKIKTLQNSRLMEICGLSISLVSLIIALSIFLNCRILRNKRIRIHRNLFVAMTIQVVIRLILYVDQAIVRGDSTGLIVGRIPDDRPGIDNTPVLCELFYFLLEYARTAMFMWMFIEGLYLHNLVAVAFFNGTKTYSIYCLLGWGSPLIFTSVWAAFTATFYKGAECWWGYNFTSYFWILEGPRMFVIAINLLFLLNIIRILITKLKETNSSEAQQVRKSMKAALILLPLLGITNLVNIIPPPLERSAFEFSVWSYGSIFLSSFQGFFLSLIYCFCNREVRTSLAKRWELYSNRRNIAFAQRLRRAQRQSLSTTAPPLIMEERAQLSPCDAKPGFVTTL